MDEQRKKIKEMIDKINDAQVLRYIDIIVGDIYEEIKEND